MTRRAPRGGVRRTAGTACLGALGLIALVSSIFVACNAVTGIADYQVDCQGCISDSCKLPLAECAADNDCRQRSDCFAKCSAALDIESCIALCAGPALATNVAGQHMLGCVVASCRGLCFPSGVSLDVGSDSRSEAAPSDVASESSSDALVDSSIDDAPSEASIKPPPAPVVAPGCVNSRPGATAMSELKFSVADGGPSGDFCIDQTEVTNEQYYAFWLDTERGRDVGAQPPQCLFNKDYTPQYPGGFADPPPADGRELPVVYVDWCDAFMYCKWAGKRLCGAIGGGTLDLNSPTKEFNDVTKGEWFGACANGFANTKYPYGSTFRAGTCIDATFAGDAGGAPTERPVRSALDCHGTATDFAQVFDLSGGVREWEDNCQPPKGGDEGCATRGGAFADITAPQLACDDGRSLPRKSTHPHVGFRCCAN